MAEVEPTRPRSNTDHAKQQLSKAAEISRANLRKASQVFNEKAPEVKEQVIQALRDLEEHESFKLRHPDSVEKFGNTIEDVGYAFEDFRREYDEMPISAVASVGFLGLMLVKSLDSVIETMVCELLHGRSFIARLSLIGAVVPGYIAAWHFERAVLKASDGDPYAISQFGRNARRIPPAFWAMSAISATVTFKAASEVAPDVIKRFQLMRRRVFFIPAAIIYLSKTHRREQAARLLNALTDFLPQHMGHALRIVIKNIFGVLSFLSIRLKPLIQPGLARLEKSLKLRPGMLAGKSSVVHDANDAPLFKGAAGATADHLAQAQAQAERDAEHALRGRVSSAVDSINLRPPDDERN